MHMESKVTKIYNDNYIQVNTEFGEFRGRWCSLSQPYLKKYILEFECSEIISSDSIFICNTDEYKINSCEHAIHIYGFVEDIDDNILFFRLAKDIIMFNIADDFDSSMFIGKFVCVKINELKLYDTE